MSWNYRVLRTEDGSRIFDVHDGEADTLIATNAAPTYGYGATVDRLKEQMDLPPPSVKIVVASIDLEF